MADVLSWRNQYQNVDNLLLSPKDPFIFRKKETLKSHRKGHSQCQQYVFIVDERKYVREWNGDYHYENEVCLVIRQYSS